MFSSLQYQLMCMRERIKNKKKFNFHVVFIEDGNFCFIQQSLFIFLAANSGVEVSNADSQLFCSFADQFACLGADGMSDFCTINTILHHQHFQLADIVDDEFLESVWEHMTSSCVWAISNVWHKILTLEASTDTIVNTFWFTPVALKNREMIRRGSNRNYEKGFLPSLSHIDLTGDEWTS